MKNNKIIELIKHLPSGRSIKYTLFEDRSELGEEVFSVSAEFVGNEQEKCEFAEDICRESRVAERFLYLVATEEVEPCHLKDIVCDMLPIYLP